MGAPDPNYPTKPSKRIIVCCDGTWNDSDGTLLPPTNVAKLARSIRRQTTLADGTVIPQVVFYQSGIGSKSPNPEIHSLDGLTGRGIKENVRQAYGFICNNYLWGDEIILIGFSRGAYTARVISSLISDLGILKKHGLGYFFSIFDAWQRQNVEQKKQFTNTELKNIGPDKAVVGHFEQIQQQLQNQKLDLAFSGVPIKACAVWDTVGSLGIPIDEPSTFFDQVRDGLRAALSNITPSLVASKLASYDPVAFTFVNTEVSPMIQHAFHAIALDEHRNHYQPTIWEQPDKQHWPQVLKQVWFSGNHTFIGGGNKTNNAIPNIALAWMMSQLRTYDILDLDYEHVNTTSADKALISIIGQPEMDPSDGKLIINPTDIVDKMDLGPPRTPTQYCRVDPVSQKPKPNERLVNTNETVHASVRRRFWGSTKLTLPATPYESNALKDKWSPHTAEVSITGDVARWKVAATTSTAEADHHAERPSATAVALKDLPEEPFTDFENEVLKAWSSEGNSLETYNLTSATT